MFLEKQLEVNRQIKQLVGILITVVLVVIQFWKLSGVY